MFRKSILELFRTISDLIRPIPDYSGLGLIILDIRVGCNHCNSLADNKYVEIQETIIGSAE